MSQSTKQSSEEERRLQLETGLLLEILSLHPDHLTFEEMILRVTDTEHGISRLDVDFALKELTRFGVIRINGEVLEPTFAAVRISKMLEIP